MMILMMFLAAISMPMVETVAALESATQSLPISDLPRSFSVKVPSGNDFVRCSLELEIDAAGKGTITEVVAKPAIDAVIEACRPGKLRRFPEGQPQRIRYTVTTYGGRIARTEVEPENWNGWKYYRGTYVGDSVRGIDRVLVVDRDGIVRSSDWYPVDVPELSRARFVYYDRFIWIQDCESALLNLCEASAEPQMMPGKPADFVLGYSTEYAAPAPIAVFRKGKIIWSVED